MQTNYPCHYRTDYIELSTQRLVALADTIVPTHSGERIHINSKLYTVAAVEMDIDYPNGDRANFIQRVVLDQPQDNQLIDELGAAIHQAAYNYEPSSDPDTNTLRSAFAAGRHTFQQLASIYNLRQQELVDRLGLNDKAHLERVKHILGVLDRNR